VRQRYILLGRRFNVAYDSGIVNWAGERRVCVELSKRLVTDSNRG